MPDDIVPGVNGGGNPGVTPAPAKPTDVTPPAGGAAPTTPSAPAAAQPKAGEQPGAGRVETVPKDRFTAEVTRWRKRAEEAELKLSAQSVRPAVAPAAPVASPAAPAAGEGTPPAATPGVDTSQFVTKSELELQDERRELVAEGKRMLQTYDGSNGYPAFDLDSITEHMKRTGFRSYEAAYRDLHFSEIVEVEKAKAVEQAATNNQPTTVGKGGPALGQPPAPGTLSREGIAKMPVEEYAKMGGSKALRDKVLHGQLQ